MIFLGKGKERRSGRRRTRGKSEINLSPSVFEQTGRQARADYGEANVGVTGGHVKPVDA